MSCEFHVAFPHSVVRWSPVGYCGISLSYSLAFCIVDTGLDRNNTRRYVDVTKLSIRHNDMLNFISGTRFYWI